MSERPKERDWKSRMPLTGHRGFESLSLHQKIFKIWGSRKKLVAEFVRSEKKQQGHLIFVRLPQSLCKRFK